MNYNHSGSFKLRNLYQTIGKLIFLGLALTPSRFAFADVIDSTVSFITKAGATSTSVIAPAYISFFDAYQSADVQVNGGIVNWLNLYNNSTASISGGDMSWLRLHDNSSVRITGVESLSWLVFFSSSSKAEIVANNVQYNGGHLSGIWGNGKSFNFWAVKDAVLSNNIMPSNILVTSVPEPSTAILLIGGITFLVARRSYVVV